MLKDYEMVIGLEVHVELKTKSKIFCSCPTDFGAAPNTQCCPVCMGMPGTLPVLNGQVVSYAIKAIEIVSEPDIRSAKEAAAYLQKLKAVISYTGISDCKMNEGSLRCDVNLSVRKKGDATLGTRTEMKNLNSFQSVAKAIEQEYIRQVEAVEKGEKIIQETRRFDQATGVDIPISPANLARLADLLEEGQINSSAGKKVLGQLWEKDQDPEEIVKEQGLYQLSDTDALLAAVRAAIAQNPGMLEGYKKGKLTMAKALMGQAMAYTQGKANPVKLQELLQIELDKA